MLKKIIQSDFFVFVYLIAFAVLTRLIPHPWNTTAIGALALFSGSQFKKNTWSFGVPILALLISDMFLGFHATMPFVYGAVLLIVWLGQGLKYQWFAIGSGSLVASVIFFIITNVGVWAIGDLYPRTAVGFMECFTMAWPFFRAQLLGDLVYSGALFGLWAVLQKFAVYNRINS